MKIWVDADACPAVIKDILYRAANRVQIPLTLRNFMEGLRGSGVETGGPAAFAAADRHSFAKRLDGLLALREDNFSPGRVC
jgi:uncharacterized protein YaiI (UPF0178 family)